ncbi:hypothetical protein D3C78_1803050 [compost metagenome]
MALAVGGDQLAERAVTAQLAGGHGPVEALGEGGLAFEQLRLVAGAHQEELAGGLLPGQFGDARGLGEQLRLLAQPLADIVLRVQLPQATGAEQQ